MFAVLTRLSLKGRLRAEGDGSLSPRLLPIEKKPEKDRHTGHMVQHGGLYVFVLSRGSMPGISGLGFH